MQTDDCFNQTNAVGGHFLRQDLSLFDAAFFNVSSEVASVSIKRSPHQ